MTLKDILSEQKKIKNDYRNKFSAQKILWFRFIVYDPQHGRGDSMTSYQIEIKQCPGCNGEFKAIAVCSHNTISAKFYTDGFVNGPMYDEGSALLNCPRCFKSFWSEDILTTRIISDSEYLKDHKMEAIPFSWKFKGHDYVNAIHRKLWKNKSQEKYIRIRAWWSSNHIHRPQASLGVKAELALKEIRRKSIEYSESLPDEPLLREACDQRRLTEDPENLRKERIANLQKLLELHDTEDTNDIIIRCEILRELEWFDECLKLINNSFREEYPQIIKVIKKLAEADNNQVALIE